MSQCKGFIDHTPGSETLLDSRVILPAVRWPLSITLRRDPVISGDQ